MNRVSGTSHSNNPTNARMSPQMEKRKAATGVNRESAMKIGLRVYRFVFNGQQCEQDVQKGLASHPPNPGDYFTRPP